MKKLQCELCNSVDIVKIGENMYQCQHCGCKYTAEQARAMLSGTVEIVKGSAELERQLANAQTQAKLHDYQAAMASYAQLQKEYAADYRVWWGELEARLSACEKDRTVPRTEEMRNMKETLRRVFTLCKDEAALDGIKRTWLRFWEDAAKNLISGKYVLDEFQYWNDHMSRETADFYGSFSAGMKKAMEYGFSCAATLNAEGITYFYDTHSEEYSEWSTRDDPKHAWMPAYPGAEIFFALGRHLVTRIPVEDGTILHNFLLKKSITPLDAEHLATLRSEVQKHKERCVAYGQCPYCRVLLKKSIFGIRCPHCGRRF